MMENYPQGIDMDKVSVILTPTSIVETRLDTGSTVARKMDNYSEIDAQWTSSCCQCD